MPTAKIGRPLDTNPKRNRIDIRITDEDMQFLEEYCKKTGKSKPEAIRDGINALKSK